MTCKYLIRRFLSSLVILLIVFLSVGHFAHSENESAAAANSIIWHFGCLPQKSEVSHTFYLPNKGSSPLAIKEIKSGCSCTSVSKIEKPIEPGDSAAIAVTFKSGRYRGAVTKTTKVFTDDPVNEIYELTIQANVIKKDEACGIIKLLPQKLEWVNDNNIISGDSIINIANTGPDTLSVSVFHQPENIINKIKLPLILPPDSETDVPIKPKPANIISFEMKGTSITFAVIGRDTTIVTMPIEIKK
ncbi:MAG: hypothetical protein CVT49_05140 [candidate division Zixibacteria bacterium HGW-Zixibacteria-1]|nr:MAG: hypothetical protein CVT49_05140 [candidate division Zixibacteria bacterium HGW-Zixibacteria-1]